MAPVQVYDTMPTDKKLFGFYATGLYAPMLRLEESETKFIIHPDCLTIGFYMRFMTVTFSLVMLVTIATSLFVLGNSVIFWALLPIHPMVVFGILAIAWEFITLRRDTIMRLGPFLIMEKDEATLSLPRIDMVCMISQVHSVVICIGSKQSPEIEGTAWRAEMSLLLQNDRSRLERFVVLDCEQSWQVREVGKQLSEYCGINYQVLQTSWWSGTIQNVAS